MDFITILITIGLMAGIAGILGLLIVIVNKYFEVKEDTRVSEVLAHLPGSNCGGCGQAGCAALAKELVDGKVSIDDCGQLSDANKAEIGNILGISVSGSEPTMAVVACSGGIKCQEKYEYQGYGSCVSQELLCGGKKACDVGCMGSGSCVDACPSYAIEVKEGVAKVDKINCTACGMCIQTCPKKIIKRIPANAQVYIACSTQCKGKDVSSVCTAGCIACGMCAKVCPSNAIVLVNNEPVIDYAKCTACHKCVASCPRKVIFKV